MGEKDNRRMRIGGGDKRATKRGVREIGGLHEMREAVEETALDGGLGWAGWVDWLDGPEGEL